MNTKIELKRGDVLTSKHTGRVVRVTRVAGEWFWAINNAAGFNPPRGYSHRIHRNRLAEYWRGEKPANAVPLLAGIMEGVRL